MGSIFKRKKNKIKREIEEAYNNRLRDLNIKQDELIKREKDFDKKIKKMENIIKEQKDLIKKVEIEKEKIKLEVKQREEKQKIKELEKRKKAINKCKEYLSEEFILCITNSFDEFNEIEKSWINELKKKGNENHKKNFVNLFQKLFKSENIEQKIMNKFIEIVNNTYKKNELKKMNFMLIGPSGVGKSTLINALLQEDLAKEGSGKVCTTKIERYESKNFPFISLFDSIGAELGKEYTLEDVQNDTLKLIKKQLNNPDPNEHIHCIIYCLTFNRVYRDELKIILKIREVYGNKLPIVIVYTMANDNNKIKATKEAINEILYEFGESLSEDIFDYFKICFLKLYAKEDKIIVNDKEHSQKCFGLSDLISICYKKGEQSYKIALKNSLIQIAHKNLKQYIEIKSDEYKNNIELYLYLEEKFEPNFSNFIAYIFENITNVLSYGNFHANNSYQKSKQNLIIIPNNNPQNKIINLPINDKNKCEYKCIYCSRVPTIPYKCGFCGSYACQDCFLEQFSFYDKPKCKICTCDKIEKCKEENYDKMNKFPLNNINNNNANICNIVLKNNLNNNSKNEIYFLIESYKNEMLIILKKNFNNFIEDEAQKLYIHILEKFNAINLLQSQNLKEGMKSKEQLKNETISSLKIGIEEIAQDNFLRNSSILLFGDIIEVFKIEMGKKIQKFIDGLERNYEVKNVFKSLGFLETDKPINLWKEFNQYINSLKEIEKQSHLKTLNK